MTTLRRSIPDFQLANPIYAGARVSFYTVNPSTGLKTSTLATLYAAATGATTAANPQTLDGSGKFSAPVFSEVPVIAAITSRNVESHDTGPIQMRGTWRGTWVTDTVYFSGDTVTDALTGDVLVAADDHTSGASVAADTAAGHLTIIIDISEIAGLGDVDGPASSTDNEIPRYHLTTGKIIQASGVLIDDSSNVTPAANDVGALGTTSLKWGDIFLASGAVVNFNSGDVTVTHSANALAFAGASSGYSFDANILLVEGAAISWDGGDASITQTGNVLTFAGATTRYEFDANLTPSSSDGAALGTSSLMFADLFLASGGTINFNASDVTVTHSTNTLAFAGASSGYTFDAAPLPASSDGAALGSASVMWSDLFLASGAVINFNNGNFTATHTAGVLTLSGDLLWGGAAWSSWAPTISASAGTITTVGTTVARYKQFGKMVAFALDVTITTNGTGSGFFRFTLPVTASTTVATTFYGGESVVSAKSVWGFLLNSTTVNVIFYDGTYPVVDNARILVSGVYQAA